MPIVRTYGCEGCGHFIEVTLTLAQADDPPPECPFCAGETRQEFKPVAITGSPAAKANKIAEDILENDYGVAHIERDRRQGSTPKVRYKDQGTPAQAGTWGTAGAMMEQAVAIGRQTRADNGGYSPVAALQHMIKTGVQPDLIENSKKMAIKVW